MIPRKAVFFLGAFLFCISGVAKAQTKPRVVHVFVTLADNEHQGFVPVPAFLGNGDDPAGNLYWGAAFGVRTFFKNAPEWKEILYFKHQSSNVLERSIFQNRNQEVLLVADAYRGSEIRQALTDFFCAAAGIPDKQATSGGIIGGVAFQVPTTADLVVYVGHDGLMDFPLTVDFGSFRIEALCNRPGLRQQVLFPRSLAGIRGHPALMDEWADGSRGVHLESRPRRLDTAGIERRNSQARGGGVRKVSECSDVAAMRLFSSDW